MERFRDVLTRRAWLPAVLWWAATVVSLWLILPDSPLASGAGSSIGGPAAGLYLRRRREKRLAGGTTGQLASLEGQLREAELPAGPERRNVMRELVDGRLTRTAHRGPALAASALVTTVVTVLTAVIAGVLQALVLGLLEAVFLTWLGVASGRARSRLLRMRDLLAKAPPGVPPPRAAPPLRAASRDPAKRRSP